MRKLLSSVAIVTMTLNASYATAQTELQQDQSKGVPHAHDHASHQHDEMPEKLPEAKRKADTAGPHGGTVRQVGELKVETIIEPGGLRLFLTDRNGKSVNLSGARGLATLQLVGEAKRYRYDLFPEVGDNNQAESMAVAVDLSRLAGRNVELTYQLVGVQGADRRPLQFSATASIPMTESQRVAAAIAEQKVCPVSGLPLGGMGKPIPVIVGDQTVYVCCKGCIIALKSKPEKYLVSAATLSFTPSTAADADAIALQKVCPVTGEPLGSMGTPIKVTGLSRELYLCCKGCVNPLQKDPQKYLVQLTGHQSNAMQPMAPKRELSDMERTHAVTIGIEGMHCGHCANHVTETLQAIQGAGEVRVDLESKQAIVLPKDPKSHPSVSALWDGMVKSGYTPVELTAHGTVYRRKP